MSILMDTLKETMDGLYQEGLVSQEAYDEFLEAFTKAYEELKS
jgi:hypothetical protein